MRLMNAVIEDRTRVVSALLHGVGNHLQNRLTAENAWTPLAQTIQAASARGLSGKAGETTVRMFDVAGRRMITLARGDQQVTFVGADEPSRYDDDFNEIPESEYDPLAWPGAAVHSMEAPLSLALAMIEDLATQPCELAADQRVSIA